MRTGKIQALGTVHSLREELNLPLDFQLTLCPGAEEALRQALANQPAASVQFNGTMVHVRCLREQKMAMLHVLAMLDGALLDLHIKEPSLEDVFLGYSDATA